MQNQLPNIIVAGIGPDVGKTITSAILVKALTADYWKPVQCGNLEASDTMTIRSLVDTPQLICHEEAYTFRDALSPHIAAEHENKVIREEKLRLPVTTKPLVIECAGGLMVPLNDHLIQIEAMKKYDCVWILVSRHYLGCINHTLMSIELLKRYRCRLAGIIFNGNDSFGAEEAIMKRTNAPVIGRLSHEPQILNPTHSQTIINRYAEQWKAQLQHSLNIPC